MLKFVAFLSSSFQIKDYLIVDPPVSGSLRSTSRKAKSKKPLNIFSVEDLERKTVQVGTKWTRFMQLRM